VYVTCAVHKWRKEPIDQPLPSERSAKRTAFRVRARVRRECTLAFSPLLERAQQPQCGDPAIARGFRSLHRAFARLSRSGATFKSNSLQSRQTRPRDVGLSLKSDFVALNSKRTISREIAIYRGGGGGAFRELLGRRRRDCSRRDL